MTPTLILIIRLLFFLLAFRVELRSGVFQRHGCVHPLKIQGKMQGKIQGKIQGWGAVSSSRWRKILSNIENTETVQNSTIIPPPQGGHFQLGFLRKTKGK